MTEDPNRSESRNLEVLLDFVRYCTANPELRFWQALMNWSGYKAFSMGENNILTGDISTYDPYCWEGKRHDS